MEGGAAHREKSQETPAIARPEAASRVASAVRRSVADSIDNTGKAIATVAGTGVFFFAAGYYIEWQRLKEDSLPAEEILPLIPKEQVAAAGVRELFVSTVFAGLVLAFLGVLLVWLIRLAHDPSRRWVTRLLKPIVAREGIFATGAIGLLTLMLVPTSKGGIVSAIVVTVLFFVGIKLVNDFLEAEETKRFPLWQLSLAVAIVAIVLTTARQWEFPERRPVATVTLTNGSVLRGRYVASDANRILIVNGDNSARPPVRLIDLRRDRVRNLRLERRPPEEPGDRSLLAELLAPLPAAVQLTCIPPECRSGNNDRIGPSSAF